MSKTLIRHVVVYVAPKEPSSKCLRIYCNLNDLIMHHDYVGASQYRKWLRSFVGKGIRYFRSYIDKQRTIPRITNQLTLIVTPYKEWSLYGAVPIPNSQFSIPVAIVGSMSIIVDEIRRTNAQHVAFNKTGGSSPDEMVIITDELLVEWMLTYD